MEDRSIIVSMTSYPARIDLVPVAYDYFINHQTLKSNKYVLWLSKEEFGGEKTPENLGLVNIVNQGVEIYWCEKCSFLHIRHNSCLLWPHAYNIMIDEDIYYPDTYVEELMDAACKYSDCVISYMSCFEIFTGYKKYELPKFPWPSIRNKFNGGLVCFPPFTYPDECFKYADIRDCICPIHDETWVNLFLKYKGVKVYGIHKLDWRKFSKYFKPEDEIENLHNRNVQTEAKYSRDIIQFNKVLFVFPQLRKVYKRVVFGLYNFCDVEEISVYNKEYEKCNSI